MVMFFVTVCSWWSPRLRFLYDSVQRMLLALDIAVSSVTFTWIAMAKVLRPLGLEEIGAQ